ncbi:MAG: hypothetical protein SF051_15850 [Elusimicrobiota bacterium]|nr:hypothetical protein [Elusimicrobiota bacterium]
MNHEPKRRMTTAALAALLSLAAVSARAEPTLLVIGVDVSQSNPLLLGPQFDAYREASRQRVRDAVGAMEAGSRVMIRTFGDNLATPRSLGVADAELIPQPRHPDARFRRVETLRPLIAEAVVQKVDLAIESGRADPDDYTRITRFIEAMSAPVAAHSVFQNPVRGAVPRGVRFLLLTDGIEDDPPNGRLLRGGALPASPGFTVPNCAELRLVGFGQARTTLPSDALTRMRDEWRRWSGAVGCPFVADAGL